MYHGPRGWGFGVDVFVDVIVDVFVDVNLDVFSYRLWGSPRRNGQTGCPRGVHFWGLKTDPKTPPQTPPQTPLWNPPLDPQNPSHPRPPTSGPLVCNHVNKEARWLRPQANDSCGTCHLKHHMLILRASALTTRIRLLAAALADVGDLVADMDELKKEKGERFGAATYT